MSVKAMIGFLPAAILGAIVPVAANAQSLPGMNISGDVEVEYLTSDGSDATVLFGNVDLSFGPASGGAGLGFDAGLYAIDTDNSSGESAIFAALTYRTGYGKFSFGIPRSAASTYSRMPAIGGVRLIEVSLDSITRGMVERVYLLGDDTPYGLRYDGDYGALKAAASYHRFSDIDADIYAVAVSYDGGAFFANGAYEAVDVAGTSTQTSLHAEIGAEADLYEAGIGYTKGSNFVPDAFMAWATYRPMTQLDVTASIVDPDTAAAIYGLSGSYTLWNAAYVQAGVLDTSGTDPIWDLSLGYKF